MQGTEIQAFGQVAQPLYCTYEIDSIRSGGSTRAFNPGYSAAKVSDTRSLIDLGLTLFRPG